VEIYPTAFINCNRIKIDDKDFNCIEISGLKRFRKVWKNFYNEVHAIVYVIDSTDFGRLSINKKLLEEMDKNLTKQMPIAFLINKQDIEKSLTPDQVKEICEIDRPNSNFIWQVL
jgi:signal recognition particle receptor subunit beta